MLLKVEETVSLPLERTLIYDKLGNVQKLKWMTLLEQE